MPAVTMHPYRGVGDLRAMQALAQSLWSLESRFHIGDLAWQRFEHVGRESDWPTMLWEEDGAAVAWGWAHRPECHLYLMVRPDRASLATEVLAWFETAVSGATLSVAVLDKERHLVEALRARGYHAVTDAPFDLYTALDLKAVPPKPILMPGLAMRSMADAKDVERRAASHRAAWHPSRVTTESYRNVMAAWPYRSELDWVVEVSDGRFVANCCLWLDEQHKTALLEPVGVAPGFRRLGLARAVCLHAVHAAREMGCTRVITYPRGDDAYPIPRRLYSGLGFRPYARTQLYAKQR